MSCENLDIPKTITSDCPTPVYGIPFGSSGRVVANTAFEIQGIVLHCYAGTISQLCNELKCKSKTSIISGSTENSYHYGVGTTGHINQFVNDSDISWAFGAYKNNSYASVPPPNTAVNWPTLQGINGLNTTPDVYVLNVAIALGHVVEASLQGCYNCPTASGLPQTQHDELVQLLAYLAQEYSITIDSEHINFHDLIRCDETVMCPCTDIETLLGEVAAFCPPCEGDEAPSAPEAQTDDVIEHIMGITEACCPNSPGCYVKIPWNGCFVGDLAVDGTLDSYILGLAQNAYGQWCLTRGCLAVTSPLIGCGTVDDPLRLDICAFGAWVPDEVPANVINILGIDAAGCLVETNVVDWFCEWESAITPIDTLSIDLTVSGDCDHTLQADLIISPQAGNQLQLLADGVYVSEPDCETIGLVFGTEGDVAYLIGRDAQDNCVWEAIGDAVDCDLISANFANEGDIEYLIGRTIGDLCVYEQVVDVVQDAITVLDTNCINLTWVGNVLSADPIIDPDANNILVCGATGLYVPDLVPVASNCIDVTYVGRQLTLTPIVSPSIGGIQNQLSCEATGLYVPRGAGTLTSNPIIGDGSDTNPIDIDFSLLNAQDLCDLGSIIPLGTLVDIIGRDNAGCLRRETPANVIADALIANDTATLDLTLFGNVLTGDVIVSPNVGNTLTALGNGLYVPTAAGLGTLDTNCIDLTLTAGGVLSADLRVDPAGDNQAACGPGGLYIPAGAGLIANDTDCLNLNLVGGVLTGAVIFAGAQGGVPNVVNCIPGQGLYVPEAGGITVADTSCIDLDITGAVLTADLILDPTGDNQAVCVPAGLYVPPAAGLQAVDTNCITLNLAGDTLTSTPILAPTQGLCANALQCLGDGLFVPQWQFLDDNCIEFTVVNGCQVTAQPVIDPDPCNELECRPNGFFSPQTVVVNDSVDTDNFVQFFPPGIPGSGGVLNNNLPATLVVNNPSDCCDMQLMVFFTGYQVYAGNAPGDHVIRLDGNPHFRINGVDQFDFNSHNTAHVSQSTGDGTAQWAADQRSQGYTGTVTLPAGGSLTLSSFLDLNIVTNVGANPDGTAINELFVEQAHISAMGVCVA